MARRTLIGPNGGPRHGLTLEQRFWLKVDRSGECWTWTAGLNPNGYGQMNVSGPGEPTRLARAHRVSWELHNGPIQDGMHVCHHCDNPPCVRPDHLFLGTQSDNMTDCMRKGRHPGNREGLPGTQNGNAVLSEEDVQEIRRLRSEGITGRAVAKRFGIGPAQVSRIHTGKRWKHV